MSQLSFDTATAIIEAGEMTIPDNGAIFSDDRVYRYVYARRWEPGVRAVWLLHNPSIAGEVKNDPTATKVTGFSKRLGYAGAIIVNPWAFVETKPKEMRAALKRGVDIVGPDNDHWLETVFMDVRGPGKVIAGWGANVKNDHPRIRYVVAIAATVGVDLFCLGTSQGGQPNHPLMLAYKTPLVPWRS